MTMMKHVITPMYSGGMVPEFAICFSSSTFFFLPSGQMSIIDPTKQPTMHMKSLLFMVSLFMK